MSKVIHEKELLAYLAGEEVEFRINPCKVISADDWQKFEIDTHSLERFNHSSYEFRIVAKTVTVELPQPFIPNEDDFYWFIKPDSTLGYGKGCYEPTIFDLNMAQRGVWRTEEEVKQVVMALENMKRSVK